MTSNRDDSFDVHFARLGIPKPTIAEFVAGLQEVGYQFTVQDGGIFILNPVPQTDEDAERLREANERFPLAMFNANEIRRFIMLGQETPSTRQADLPTAFSGAIAALDRHTRMEALYDALAHLSDSLSGLVSRPRIGPNGPTAEALEALDDFIMDQLDAVKNRALAVPPAAWPDHEAKYALLMKHVARFRTDASELEVVMAQIVAGLEATQPDA